ncbi:WAT1-related protein At1g09380 [Ricinus communis]|uniref:WAT1-related protein n=1 Tax=Ricinus communis TaxID=3988 RepID=B9RFN0_RICCO|nr:WAT1-related protein At1g09380 [Ricinus communis]EEF50001.1 Auxin-induced protein 5NG4, putative [Ricinus communis]|eukprot:XP_002512549.1 WAT1-related protein At1g09380 [Ricinus communis]
MDAVNDFFPFLAMVIVQFGFAGMNITSKLAMDSGMKPLVLVSYRQIFATIAMVPFAYFFEWKTRPKITKPLLIQIFICSLTGVTGNQVFYFIGLENSTPTIGCALTNILPAVTFILAVLLRQESVGIKKISGQAKLLGTVICVGGAMLLSFYHGPMINIGESSIHWKYADETGSSNSAAAKSSFILGPVFIMASAVSWAVWFTLQAKVSVTFPAPYTSTLLMCFMGSIECVVIGLGANHELSQWSLRSPGRLIAALYAGIVCSALAFSLTSWSIQKKGALYVSVFSPLLLVIVAVLSWALLREKLYLGTVVGSGLIVAGLYAVLWGKDKEMKMKGIEDIEAIKQGGGKEERGDLELQLPANSNGSNGPAK